jgi:hypothetical protein
VLPEGLGQFKNPPHRDLNPRPSGLQHSALLIIFIYLLILYLTTLLVGQTNGTQRRIVGRLVKDKLQMGTEVVVTNSEILSGRVPG